MSKEIKATPNSFRTSDLTPIVLQDSPNVRIYFNGVQVDNNSDIEKNIKGTLIIEKKTKSQTFEQSKFTRKDISAYDQVAITLDTEATAALCSGLIGYYKAFGGKTTIPYEEVSYIQLDDDILYIKQLLEKNKNLAAILEQIDTTTLNSALNIKNLKQIKKEIEDNLDNSSEDDWQKFFSRNTWALSQLFNAPFMIYQNMRYVGGKSIDNKGGKYTDYIYKNPVSKNVSLIEIKTPMTSLFEDGEYRPDVPYMSKDLIGGVNQLLSQRQNLYNEYIAFRNKVLDKNDDFYAINIQCILLMGKLSPLSALELKSFIAYRNELKNIHIITFDELLEKVNNLIALLEI